jgi:hypothetical protein
MRRLFFLAIAFLIWLNPVAGQRASNVLERGITIKQNQKLFLRYDAGALKYDIAEDHPDNFLPIPDSVLFLPKNIGVNVYIRPLNPLNYSITDELTFIPDQIENKTRKVYHQSSGLLCKMDKQLGDSVSKYNASKADDLYLTAEKPESWAQNNSLQLTYLEIQKKLNTGSNIQPVAQSEVVNFSFSFLDLSRTGINIGESNVLIKILNTPNFKFSNDKFKIESIDKYIEFNVISFDSLGLNVNFSIPVSKNIVGERRIIVKDEVGNLKGSFNISIRGGSPRFDVPFKNYQFIIGDPTPKAVPIYGDNFYSITELSVDGNDFFQNGWNIIDNRTLTLTLLSGSSKSVVQHIKLLVNYINENGERKQTNITLTGISTNNPSPGVMFLSCSSMYIDDIVEKNFQLQIDIPNVTCDEINHYKLTCKEISIDTVLSSRCSGGHSYITFRANDKISSGIKHFSLRDIAPPNISRYEGEIELIDAPVIKSISNLVNNDLLFNPSGNSQIIQIDGENLQDIKLVSKDLNNVFKVGNPEILDINNTTLQFIVFYNTDSVDFINKNAYKYALQRNDKKIYRKLFFKVEEPSKPYPVKGLVQFSFNKKYTNYQPLDNQFVIKEVDSLASFNIKIKQQSIPKVYGNQALEGKIEIFDEKNNLINSYPIVTNKINIQGIEIPNKYLNMELIDTIINAQNLFQDLEDLPPFATIKIIIEHKSDFYPKEYSKYRESNFLSIKVKNKGWSNWRIVGTLPPYMYALGCTSTSNWYAQPMPLNMGVGLIKQFRTKEAKLKWFDFGFYIMGLNFAPATTSNSTSDTSYHFIKPSDIALTCVFEMYPFIYSGNTRIPIQIGGGYICPFFGRTSRFFFTIGFSYNLIIPKTK